MDDFFTVEEIAEKLKVPETLIRKWLREKKLKGLKLGGLWRIPEKNYKEFLEESIYK